MYLALNKKLIMDITNIEKTSLVTIYIDILQRKPHAHKGVCETNTYKILQEMTNLKCDGIRSQNIPFSICIGRFNCNECKVFYYTFVKCILNKIQGLETMTIDREWIVTYLYTWTYTGHSDKLSHYMLAISLDMVRNRCITILVRYCKSHTAMLY